MPPRSLATLLVLVFAAVRTSAATGADGSSPGSNGCCAATNECPPCCVYKVVQTNGDGTKECRCHFCEGVTAKIDAACTSPPPPAGEVAVRSSCPAEYPTYAGGGIGANVCEYCYNDGTLTWEEQAAMINGYLPRPPPPPPGQHSGLAPSAGICFPDQAAISGCNSVATIHYGGGWSISTSGLISCSGSVSVSGSVSGSGSGSGSNEDSAAASLGTGALGTTLLVTATTALVLRKWQ